MAGRIIDRLFLSHPRSAGQGYLQHLRFAWRFGAGLASGALAAFVHGLLPFVLKSHAGDRVRELHARLEERGGAPRDLTPS